MHGTRLAEPRMSAAARHGTSLTPARGAMRHIWQQSSEDDAAVAVADSDADDVVAAVAGA